MKTLFKTLRSFFLVPFRLLMLHRAIAGADRLYGRYHHRFYVIPVENKLLVVNRYRFRDLKQRGFISKNANIRDLLKECFYFTPDTLGRTEMTPRIRFLKRKMFLEYMDSL